MPLKPFERIATPRLILRPVIEADLPQLLPISGDPLVTDFLPYDTWSDLTDAQAWLVRTTLRCADGNGMQLVIERQTDRTIVGTAILFGYDEASARVEVGYVLGRSHWGCGHAREAVGALVAYAFREMGMHRIEAQVNPVNTASCKLIEALGFRLEGHLRDRYTGKGRTYGVNLYGKLASD